MMWPDSSASSDCFAGRVAVIATMHRKEQVIAPRLESTLRINPLVPTGFDTDVLGTFSREIPRPADPRTTARLKAQAALDLTGESLAIASEGSFGPHPQLPFLACDRELVLLLDRQHQLEIVGEVLSTETNYRSQTIHSLEEAFTFAQTVGFPEHGLVVMPEATVIAPEKIVKGITTAVQLLEAVTQTLAQSPNHSAHIETDMRALYNPTRMQVIAEATQALLEAVEQTCPQCYCPGFSLVQRQPGLPCSWCGSPTLLTLSARYRCQRCQFQQDHPFPDNQESADPAHCAYCNP
jgi:hypothetical protein